MSKRRKRRATFEPSGRRNRKINIPSRLAKLSNDIVERQNAKILARERKVLADREDLLARQNTDDKLKALGYGTSALSMLTKWIDRDQETKAKFKMAERYTGWNEKFQATEEMPMWETSKLYSETEWWEGHLPFGKKPKYAIPGAERVQHTKAYDAWLESGSPEYGGPSKDELIAQWTKEDPTFKVSSTQDGYVPGEILTENRQVIGSSPNIVSVEQNEQIADYLMNENTFIGGDIGQEFGIGKNSRGQIIDLDSGAVMDRELLNARIEFRKNELELATQDKPAINTVAEPKVHAKPSHWDETGSHYSNQKVGGWKGKLGVYDTSTGFKADYGRAGDDRFSASWKGQGWTETGEGTLAYDVGVGDALAAYNIYSNYVDTNWDGQGMGDWSHDEWGAGLQMVGSALYFVPIPGARVVGSVLNIVGAGIEHYGDKDEDWWFGESSAYKKFTGLFNW